MTIAYHDACHLGHAQGVRAQPRRLLQAIPGLELREIAESELCCGSAGIYNILNPETARELGDRKAANVVATGADLLVTANPGCLMQVDLGHRALPQGGHPMGLAHTIEVLDASIRGLPGRHPASHLNRPSPLGRNRCSSKTCSRSATRCSSARCAAPFPSSPCSCCSVACASRRGSPA